MPMTMILILAAWVGLSIVGNARAQMRRRDRLKEAAR